MVTPVKVSAAAAGVIVSCVVAFHLSPRNADMASTLKEVVDHAVTGSPVQQGVSLFVISDMQNVTWSGAAGLADPSTTAAMTPHHPVRIASNTKTFIAAAILRLWEDGKLELDGPISQWLSSEHSQLLRSDGYDLESITVRHLLNHTSGLFDHSDSSNYLDQILADTTRRWTRTDQIRGAVEWGKPWGKPGEFYHYSDTGYVLLGEIVERATKRPMAEAVRALLDYQRLGLTSTWFETLEPKPASAWERAHQYFDSRDVTDYDPSYDLYGGGGLVSTVGDLARFMRAVFKWEVYRQPSTVDIMLSTLPDAKPSPGADDKHLPPGAYRMGVWVDEVVGFEVYEHTGYFGTLAAYVPELELSIAASMNSNNGGPILKEMERAVIDLFARDRAQSPRAK